MLRARTARRRSGSAAKWAADLDGDVATELVVARAIDLAHAARAERRDDPVGAELTIRRRGLRACGANSHTSYGGCSRNSKAPDS